MKKFLGLIALACLSGQFAYAQMGTVYYQPDTVVKVFGTGSDEKLLAGCGGFNSPQFAVGDLNNDGRKDLVIFEKGSAQIKTFINYGTPGNPDYKYRPAYAANFPTVNEFLKLADYNCDNVPDLIQRGYTGYSIWRGSYNTNNELTFTFYRDLYYYQQNNGWINAYSEPNDVPGMEDIDNDGDLDFLSFDITGGKIDWYRNMRVEDGLPCDSIRLRRQDACWGKSFQGFIRSYALGTSCYTPPFMLANNSDDEEAVSSSESTSKTTHTGNTICLLDADGDGDYDYLNGNVSFADIQYLTNGRVDYNHIRDTMIAQDTIWGANGIDLSNVQWPAAFWVDYDDDGDKDLVFSPHAEGAADNYKTITWYKNTVSDNAPNFVYQSDTLMVSETIDMGSHSHPVFYDYDKDGKPDLFIGADGFYQANGTLRGQIAYYKNISTTGNPSFELQTLNFANISSLNIPGATPAFGDLDNDGKDDMVLGHADGSVTFYRNDAASASVQPIWTMQTLTLKDNNSNNIDSGNAASPVIYDMDGDGKKDLVIGNKVGWLYYYKNVGTTAGTVVLQHQTSKLGLARTDRLNLLSGYSAPYIGRVDNSNVEYLVIGSNSGTLHLYTGFQGGNVTTAYTLLDTAYSSLNNTIPYYGGYRSAPAFADIDGDGSYEMMMGNVLGGVTIYRNIGPLHIPGTILSGANKQFSNVYPNPAKDQLFISWTNENVKNREDVTVSLYNAVGALVSQVTKTAADKKVEMQLTVSAGIYFCKVTIGSNTELHRVVIR